LERRTLDQNSSLNKGIPACAVPYEMLPRECQ